MFFLDIELLIFCNNSVIIDEQLREGKSQSVIETILCVSKLMYRLTIKGKLHCT